MNSVAAKALAAKPSKKTVKVTKTTKATKPTKADHEQITTKDVAEAKLAKKPPVVPVGMQVVMEHNSELHRYPNNPRRNAHAVPAVLKSLKEFGWRQPVVVDKDRFIVVGDTRFQASQQLALSDPTWEWVPVVYASDLTPAQINAYRLADNRVGEISEWDDAKLFAELQEVIDEGFDLAGMGFTEEELYESTKVVKKEDTRYLEDFEVMPQAKPKFILISAPEDKCAQIMGMINAQGYSKEVKMEYSGDPSGSSAKKAA